MNTLYAYQIRKRRITILDVPVPNRDSVLDLLDDCDRRRMQELIDKQRTD